MSPDTSTDASALTQLLRASRSLPFPSSTTTTTISSFSSPPPSGSSTPSSSSSSSDPSQILYAHRQPLSGEEDEEEQSGHEEHEDSDGETSAYAALGSDAKRPHLCIYQGCGKTFGRLEHLKRHIRSHTGERPYGCSYPGCNKRFSRYDNMLQHSRCHTKVSQRKKRVNKDLFKPFVAPPPRAPAQCLIGSAPAGMVMTSTAASTPYLHKVERSVSPNASRVHKKHGAEKRHSRKSSLSSSKKASEEERERPDDEDPERARPFPLLSKSSNSSLFSHTTTEDMDSLGEDFDEDGDEDEEEDEEEERSPALSTSLPNMSSKWHLDVLLSASDALSQMSFPGSPSPLLSRPEPSPAPSILRSQEAMPAVDVRKLDDYFLQQLQVANTLCSFKKTETGLQSPSSNELISGKPALLSK